MNQIRIWEGKCQRCWAPADSYTMSMFDVALICMVCYESEKKSPRYKEAHDADCKAIKEGNYNFKGIGWKKAK